MTARFDAQLDQRRARVENLLDRILLLPDVPARLRDTMRYSVLGGGKRLRPLLCQAAAEAVGGSHEAADIPACAVELIHAYSLIHDDLPAMDDDKLRRGKPTCHLVWGEAAAILAGDALQALAFELIATSGELGCGQALRLRMLAELARASGAKGMVGGQILDIDAAGGNLDEQELGRMHGMKTGALISASIILGALSTNIATEEQLATLRDYSRDVGLAFQVRDDILDVESGSRISGKEQGKDARNGKPTYSSMLGLELAKQRLRELQSSADAKLESLGSNADGLRILAQLIMQREA